MKQVKSKQRVADHGEVFTAEREVNAMLDMVKQETERIDSRFLEPACGDGNFLVEILRRKLAVVTKKYRRSPYDWERYSLLALGSIYGIDIMIDNTVACRDRLYDIWNKEYKRICKKECSDDTRASAKFILQCNIVCGNALSLHQVDEATQDTAEPIVFSEWVMPTNDARFQRTQYEFRELAEVGDREATILDQGITNDQGETVFLPEPKGTPQICHYRRIWEYGG